MRNERLRSVLALSSALGLLPDDFLECPHTATHNTHLAPFASLRLSTFAFGFTLVHDVETEATGRASARLCRQPPRTGTRTEGQSERFARFEAFDFRY